MDEGAPLRSAAVDPSEARAEGRRQEARSAWDRAVELFKQGKPLRSPTREELMADARRGNWRHVTHQPIPADREVILAREGGGGHWLIKRFDPSTIMDTTYIHGRPATHWAEDTIGTPAS